MASRAWDVDPFPQIPCALLHSGDVLRYALHGPSYERLFQPFDPNKLKSASYEIPFRGTVYWWNPDGSAMLEQILDRGATFEIPRNSIVFVRPMVRFHIPDYLALRFNLHIRLVHRGLLLGTGPLVDPGFQGNLLIPIHNLTDSPLQVAADDGLIWIEVTKVSPLRTGNPPNDNADYTPFPPDKRNREPWQYFRKANRGQPIRSSLPSLEARVELEMKKARDELNIRVWRLEFGAAIGVVVAIATIWISLFQVYESTKSLVFSTQQIVQDSRSKTADEYRVMVDRISVLERQLAAAAARPNDEIRPSGSKSK